jgi:hypothetical protein
MIRLTAEASPKSAAEEAFDLALLPHHKVFAVPRDQRRAAKQKPIGRAG